MDKIIKNKNIRKLLLRYDRKRNNDIVGKIQTYLKLEDKIIDVGAGLCTVARKLKKTGYDISPVDVKNISLFDDIIPVVYDGKNIPFKNDSFDTALLITVLHHTHDPKEVLLEAKRVARKIIVMEDTYKGSFQKYLTFAMDSLTNLEFINHPYSHKPDRKWRSLFQEVGLEILDSQSQNYWKFFTSTTYFLQRT